MSMRSSQVTARSAFMIMLSAPGSMDRPDVRISNKRVCEATTSREAGQHFITKNKLT